MPTANDRDKFATYSRDSSTGLDYAMNRYYGSSMGRFLTPDPYGGSPTLARPSSWNRYAYVEGDPINSNDPSGLFIEGVADSGFGDFTTQGYYWLFALIDAYFAANAPSQAAGAPVAPGIGVAQTQLTRIAHSNFKSKGQCRDFFGKLIEQNNLDMSVDALMDQFQSTAAEAAKYVYDGPSSSTPIDAEKFPGIDSAMFQTVGQFFAIRTDEAISQFNGAAIWIRQANWTTSWMPGWDTYGGAYGRGTLAHELFHKKSVGGGFSHLQIENALDTINALSGVPSKNKYSVSLGNICFSD